MEVRDNTRLGVAAGLCLLVFVVDLAVPAGYVTGLLYVVPLVLLLPSRVWWHVPAVGVLASALVVLDPFLGRWVAATETVVANRGLTVACLWLVVAISTAHRLAATARDTVAARASGLLERVVRAAPDGLLLVADTGLITQANPAAERLFGYHDGALAGQPLQLLLAERGREEHGLLMAGFFQAPGARAMALNRAVQGLRRDGTVVALEVTLSHFVDGRPYVLAAVRDVSERMKLEERLRATQRMEAIGRLAGGVAHDFNNMLAAIIGNARLAQDALPAGSVPAEDIGEVLTAARRAAELTKQLLAFSRKQIIEPRPVNVNELVAEMRKMLERLVGASVVFDAHPASGLWTVRIDPSQFEQVLLNLVVNARDAMPDGGTVTLETSNITIDAEYARSHPDVVAGEYAMLAVTDTGLGMQPEVRVRIFEPFYTTKPVGSGTGLGLATCYGVVKQAGGHIWVYSEPGKGTTFKVYLPRVKDAAEALRCGGPAPTARGGTETVLVVEDEASLRRVVVRSLRTAGYTVIEASNGQDALLKLEQWPNGIDLLFTDIVMPQMGGRELAQKFAELYPTVKVLYSSGYTENAIVHRTELDPGVVFLQKPYTPEDLLKRLRQVLDA